MYEFQLRTLKNFFFKNQVVLTLHLDYVKELFTKVAKTASYTDN